MYTLAARRLDSTRASGPINYVRVLLDGDVVGDVETAVEIERVAFGHREVPRLTKPNRVLALRERLDHDIVAVCHRGARSTEIAEDPRRRCREGELRRF